MKSFFLPPLFFFLVLCQCFAQPYGGPGEITKVPKASSFMPSFGYLEYLPENYDPNESYPLLLFLHGVGMAGEGTLESLDTMFSAGPFRLLEEGTRDFNAIVIAPQSFNGWFNATQVEYLYVRLNREYNIDTDRIYITGTSAGAKGVWEYANTYPNKPAAIVPIAAAGSIPTNTELQNLPTWSFHNFYDDEVSYNFTRDCYNAVAGTGNVMSSYPFSSPGESAGNDFTFQMITEPSVQTNGEFGIHEPLYNHAFTLYDDTSHNAWRQTYDNSAMWDWLFAQSLGSQNNTDLAPSEITLSQTTIREGNTPEAIVGTLASDGSPVPTLSLTDNETVDNQLFQISNGNLIILPTTDYETQTSYQVEIRSTNSVGSTIQHFLILVEDVNEYVPPDTADLVGVNERVRINFGGPESVPVEGWSNLFDNIPYVGKNWDLTNRMDELNGWRLTVTNDFYSTPRNIDWPHPGDNSGRYPDEVLKLGWIDKWGGEFRIDGLNPDKLYRIRLYGNAPAEENAVMQLFINGILVGGSLDVANNAIDQDVEFFVDEIECANGELFVRVAGDNSTPLSQLAYVSCMIIDELASDLPQVTLSLDINDIEENNASPVLAATISDYTSELNYFLQNDPSSEFTLQENTILFSGSADFEDNVQYTFDVGVTNGEDTLLSPVVIPVVDLPELSLEITSLSIEENVAVSQGAAHIVDYNPTFTYFLQFMPGEEYNAEFDLLQDSIIFHGLADFESLSVYRFAVGVTYLADTLIRNIEVQVVDNQDVSLVVSAGSLQEGTHLAAQIAQISDFNTAFNYSIQSLTTGVPTESLRMIAESIEFSGSVDYEQVQELRFLLEARYFQDTVRQEVIVPIIDVEEYEIELSFWAIEENNQGAEIVGVIANYDPNLSYSIGRIPGETSHYFFRLEEEALIFFGSADYETNQEYTIAIEATDGTVVTEEIFTIPVNDDPELTLNIDFLTVTENTPAPVSIAVITDFNPSWGYFLDSSVGGTNIDKLTLINDEVNLQEVPDYETEPQLNFIVGVQYQGDTLTTPVVVEIIDELELTLDVQTYSIEENNMDSVVSALIVDYNPEFTYDIIAPPTGPGEGYFFLDSNFIRFRGMADYETRSSYSFDLQVTYEDETLVEYLNIPVINLSELSLEVQTDSLDEIITETQIAGTIVDWNQQFEYFILESQGTTPSNFSLDSGNINFTGESDFETVPVISLVVGVTYLGDSLTEEVSFPVRNLPELSLQVTLGSLNESDPVGASIGTIENFEPSFSYQVVSLNPELPTSLFSVAEGDILFLGSVTFEDFPTLDIQVQASAYGETMVENIQIPVIRFNPLEANFVAEPVTENNSMGVLAGRISNFDASLDYSLNTIPGEVSHYFFQFSGENLLFVGSADFEKRSLFRLRLTTSDGSDSFIQEIQIPVVDLTEFVLDPAILTIDERTPGPLTAAILNEYLPEFHYFLDFTEEQRAEYGDEFMLSNDSILFTGEAAYNLRSSYELAVGVTDLVDSLVRDITIPVRDLPNLRLQVIPVPIFEEGPFPVIAGIINQYRPEFDYQVRSLTSEFADANFSISTDTILFSGEIAPQQSLPALNFEVEASFLGDTLSELVHTIVRSQDDIWIDLDVMSIDENNGSAVMVGTIDNYEPTLNYAIGRIPGETAHYFFRLEGPNLIFFGGADYETKPFFRIQLEVSDGEERVPEIFEIPVNNLTEIDLELQTYPIPMGATAPVLVNTILNPNEEYEYFLASSPEGTPLEELELISNEVFFLGAPEEQTSPVLSYKVGATYQGDTLLIPVTVSLEQFVFEPATFSALPVEENNNMGVPAGEITNYNPDFTYTLGTIQGEVSHYFFQLKQEKLRFVGLANFETNETFRLRLTSSGYGQTSVQIIEIPVIDIEDTPPSHDPEGITAKAFEHIDDQDEIGQVYPNPVFNDFSMAVGTSAEVYHLTLWNTMGDQIDIQSYDLQDGVIKVVGMRSLHPGIYRVECSTSEGIIVTTFLLTP